MSDEPQKPKRRYKARARKLVLTGPLLHQLTTLAEIQCTQKEAAGVLGVSHRLLVQFLSEQPEAREAWDRGRGFGHVSLRRLLWKQAQADPAQARFLGKHWLKMDGKSPQRAADNDRPAPSQEENMARILELLAIAREGRNRGTADNPTDATAACSASVGARDWDPDLSAAISSPLQQDDFLSSLVSEAEMDFQALQSWLDNGPDWDDA